MIKAVRKVLGTKKIYTNMPFVYFLAVLAMIYIANAHYAEKNMRQIQKLKKELKEARWRCMSMESEVMHRGTRTAVAKSVEDIGLEYAYTAPGVVKVRMKNVTTDE
jgi:hypothetical protein